MSSSTRRRSLESTVSVIQEALDGKDLEAMAGEGMGAVVVGRRGPGRE